ncbi:MAG: hypothetical protein MUF22_04315 [Chitinispirillaceae bacterium]|jgi:hypothetical protein|nr:hypothetical protein [Chitinispirillaceae bacterium]
MLYYIVLAVLTLVAVFIMFLVLSRTLNNLVNLLIKLEYVVQREHDIKKEALDLRLLREKEEAKAMQNMEKRRVEKTPGPESETGNA